MPDDFTERQRAHAQDYQAQLQAIYRNLPAWSRDETSPLATRLRQTLAALEEIRAALPDAVSQGKVLAAVSILRTVLDTLEL